MTIKQNMINEIQANNGQFLATSSVWNYYTTGISIAKNTNLYNALKEAFKNGSIEKVWVGVGAKGRSQHSATDLHIFNVSKMSDEDIDIKGITVLRSEIR